MSPALVHWLEPRWSGHVRDGRAVIAGELETGRSVAGRRSTDRCSTPAHAAGMRVKFNADWPATSDMDADIAFIGNGFSVAGKAVLAEVASTHSRPVSPTTATVRSASTRTRTPTPRHCSGWSAVFTAQGSRRHLSRLGASGPASVGFTLALPLHGPASQKAKIEGEIELRGVRLSESEWKLAFAGVNGRARYDENGFSANDLRAQYDRQDGRLSLRAGPGHVRDRRQGFEAELEASLTSDDLLDRASDLAWLKPYVRGRSRWTAGIAIPAGAAPAGAAASKSTKTPAAQITKLHLLRSVRNGSGSAGTDGQAAGTALLTTPTALPMASEIRSGVRPRSRCAPGTRPAGIVRVRHRCIAEPAASVWSSAFAHVAGAPSAGRLTRGGTGCAAPRRRRLRPPVACSARVFPHPVQTFPQRGLRATRRRSTGRRAAGAGHRRRQHRRAIAAPALAQCGHGIGIDIGCAAGIVCGLRRWRYRSVQSPCDESARGRSAHRRRGARRHPVPLAPDRERLRSCSCRRARRPVGSMSPATGRSRAANPPHLNATSHDVSARCSRFVLGDAGRRHGDARFDASWSAAYGFPLGALDGKLVVNADGRLVESEPCGTCRVRVCSHRPLRSPHPDFRASFPRFAFNSSAAPHFQRRQRSESRIRDQRPRRLRSTSAAPPHPRRPSPTIEVLPKTGNLLTAVGAIAGGPVGAAVGAVANAVLQKPLGQASAKNYRVTGPWKDPKVEVVERSGPSARSAPGAG